MKKLNRIFALVAVAMASACGGEVDSRYDKSQAALSSHGHKLTVDGNGNNGYAKVVPVGGTVGFAADLSVSVKHLVPNSTYTLERAPEIGRALGADGICQRAAGEPPWTPAEAFLTFMLNDAPVTITTDDKGNGGTSWRFLAPAIPDGTVFDVMFRAVDSVSSPTSEVRSECFQVTVL